MSTEARISHPSPVASCSSYLSVSVSVTVTQLYFRFPISESLYNIHLSVGFFVVCCFFFFVSFGGEWGRRGVFGFLLSSSIYWLATDYEEKQAQNNRICGIHIGIYLQRNSRNGQPMNRYSVCDCVAAEIRNCRTPTYIHLYALHAACHVAIQNSHPCSSTECIRFSISVCFCWVYIYGAGMGGCQNLCAILVAERC